MRNFIKKIKISRLVVILASVTTLFSIIIGILGVSATGKVNNNVEEIYSDELIPITQISSIRENFVLLRLYSTKIQIKYDKKYEESIEKTHKDIMRDYENFKKSKLDNVEVDNLKIFEENYENYVKMSKTTFDLLKHGKYLTKEQDEDFTKMGVAIEEALKNIVQHDIKRANDSKVESDNIFTLNRNFLMILIILCVCICLTLTIGTIKVLKAYLKETDGILKEMAKGNLDLDINISGENEFEQMKQFIKNTIYAFSNIINDIKEKSNLIDEYSTNLNAISEEMASSSENVATAINDVAKGTGSQAEDLVEITSVLNSFGDSIEEMVNNLKELDQSSDKIANTASLSNEKMKSLIKSFSFVGESFKKFTGKIDILGHNISKIDEITVLINNIAEQTNLLALNAAIEAARAGESGKGFAVVAEEIRKLAEQSKQSSNNISSLIAEISKETKTIVEDTDKIDERLGDSSKIIDDSMLSFGDIIISIENMVPKISALRDSSENINKEKENIFEKVEGSSSIAEEISASSEEIAASSEEMNSSSQEVANTANQLSSLTSELQEKVNKFKIKE